MTWDRFPPLQQPDKTTGIHTMKKKTTMPLMYLSILAALTGARFAQVHSLIAIPLLILAVSLLVAFYASTLNQFKELSEKEQKEEREIFTHKNHD